MCSDSLHQCTRENISAPKTLALILSDFYMHSTENGHWKSGLLLPFAARILVIWGSILLKTSITKQRTFPSPQPPKLRHHIFFLNVLKVRFSDMWLKYFLLFFKKKHISAEIWFSRYHMHVLDLRCGYSHCSFSCIWNLWVEIAMVQCY